MKNYLIFEKSVFKIVNKSSQSKKNAARSAFCKRRISQDETPLHWRKCQIIWHGNLNFILKFLLEYSSTKLYRHLKDLKFYGCKICQNDRYGNHFRKPALYEETEIVSLFDDLQYQCIVFWSCTHFCTDCSQFTSITQSRFRSNCKRRNLCKCLEFSSRRLFLLKWFHTFSDGWFVSFYSSQD